MFIHAIMKGLAFLPQCVMVYEAKEEMFFFFTSLSLYFLALGVKFLLAVLFLVAF